MPESTQPALSGAAQSFSEHVRAFHRGLPPEEQALLEQVFTLAQTAQSEQGDVQGYSPINFTQIPFSLGINVPAGPFVASQAGIQDPPMHNADGAAKGQATE